jgi:hypothetical protein
MSFICPTFLVTVENFGGLHDDASDLREVGLDVAAFAFRGADQQRAGMGQDGYIIIDVDDPALGGAGLRDFVDVASGRQARADVKELADSLFLGEEPGHPAEERAVLPCGVR